MSFYDELGNRMKNNYENVPKTRLTRRTPVAIRLDGKAFHTFTRGFERPFDSVLMEAMQDTMKYLCKNIQGCVFGYTQSDEITLILIDYQKFNSEAWFNYETQKLCSVSASMATMAFNKFFQEYAKEYRWFADDFDLEERERCEQYIRAEKQGAMFDARCFNIPKEEVANLIYWRQLDATRNSIQMVGQAHYSHNELQNKTNSQIQDMLMADYNINWNDFSIDCKRGSCCIRNYQICDPYGNRLANPDIAEGAWFIDREIPIFKGEDREYIERWIFVGEE